MQLSCTEIWKPIPEIEGYEVSSIGRIKSLRSTAIERILKLQKSAKGYLRVHLRCQNHTVLRTAHRLVLLAFKGPPPSKQHQAAHLNGIKTDNRSENLIWATPKENMSHQYLHGTRVFGETAGRTKLTTKDVSQIRALYQKGFTQETIARVYGLSPSTISRLCRKERWAHLSD